MMASVFDHSSTSPITLTSSLLASLTFSGRYLTDVARGVSGDDLSRAPHPDVRTLGRILGLATSADDQALQELGAARPRLPEGFARRFGRWGSDAGGFPEDYDESLPRIFETHRAALVKAVAALPPARLDRAVDPAGQFVHHDEDDLTFPFRTVAEMLAALCSYTSMMGGEASLTRLMLGHPPVPDPFDELLAAFAGWNNPPG